MSPDQYLRKWNLEAPTKLCETQTSHIYKVRFEGKPAVLKMLTPLGSKSEANAGHALKYFGGHGAVRLLADDEGAYLLEFLPGRRLKDLVLSGQDDEATEIAGLVVKRLQDPSRVRVGDFSPKLTPLRENFRALFSLAKNPTSDAVFKRGAEVAERLLATETDVAVLHGDIHHTNIIESEDRGWVALDPSGLIGERTYDVANLFFNPDDLPDLVESRKRVQAVCERLSAQLGFDSKRVLDFAFAYGCLSSAWCLEDGLGPERRLRITHLIDQLR